MGQHATHKIHENSRASYQDAPIGKRHGEILCLLQRATRPATDRELARAMTGDPHPDLNVARPRVTELIQRGLVVEAYTAPCKTTGRNVRYVWLRQRGGWPDPQGRGFHV